MQETKTTAATFVLFPIFLAAGCPVVTPNSKHPIEAIQPGDHLLAIDEHHLHGKTEPMMVEETFRRTAASSGKISLLTDAERLNHFADKLICGKHRLRFTKFSNDLLSTVPLRRCQQSFFFLAAFAAGNSRNNWIRFWEALQGGSTAYTMSTKLRKTADFNFAEGDFDKNGVINFSDFQPLA